MAIHLPPDKVIPNVVSIQIDLSVAAIDSLYTGKIKQFSKRHTYESYSLFMFAD